MHETVVDRAAAHATPADLAVRDWLLVALSFATGIYEAICFLTFGKVLTAAQVGNLVLLGIGSALREAGRNGAAETAGPAALPGAGALGDVVGKSAHTHMFMYHGRLILSQLLGRPYHPAEYHAVPKVTFTDPEIGAVGLTEAQARKRLGTRVRTAVRPIPATDRGLIHKAGNAGFIKLVTDSERGIMVGAASAGPAGGEVLSMLTLAVHAAVPVQRLREMIYAFPSFHGAVPEAIGRLS